MSCKFDGSDRSILEFRPNISFIEPDQEDVAIEGTDRPQLEDIQENRAQIKRLAQAVNTLAESVQNRVDLRAKDVVIKLDKNADQDTIQAMRRRFPDADPTQITYEQYRTCKGDIRDKGVQVAQQALPPIENDVEGFTPGDFGTEAAANGGLRPELNASAQIIPPLDIEDVQINLICILVNFIWKNFIKKAVTSAAYPVGKVFKALPDRICNPGGDIEIPGLFILGDEVPDLLTGKVAAKAKENL